MDRMVVRVVNSLMDSPNWCADLVSSAFPVHREAGLGGAWAGGAFDAGNGGGRRQRAPYPVQKGRARSSNHHRTPLRWDAIFLAYFYYISPQTPVDRPMAAPLRLTGFRSARAARYGFLRQVDARFYARARRKNPHMPSRVSATVDPNRTATQIQGWMWGTWGVMAPRRPSLT